MRFHVAEHYAHASRPHIKYFRRSFKELICVPNLYPQTVVFACQG